jgi:hypothetical protein
MVHVGLRGTGAACIAVLSAVGIGTAMRRDNAGHLAPARLATNPAVPSTVARHARPHHPAVTPHRTEPVAQTTTSTASRPSPAPAQSVASPTPATASSPVAVCEALKGSVVWPPGWTVVCAGPRAGVLGLTIDATNQSVLYMRPGESLALLHTVLLHEAGNAWDFARLAPQGKIAQWCAARGCNPTTFFAGGRAVAGGNEAPAAEDWAASWSACHGGPYHRSYMGLGPPTPAQCALQNQLTNYRP